MEMKLPMEFSLQLSKLSDRTDDIVERVLEFGGEVVLDKVRSNLTSVIGKNTKLPSRSTGELVSALGMSPVKLDKNGNYNLKIGFSEPRSDGISNAKLASIIEYGKFNQPPRPFMKPAKTASRAASLSAMRAKFDEEVGSI